MAGACQRRQRWQRGRHRDNFRTETISARRSPPGRGAQVFLPSYRDHAMRRRPLAAVPAAAFALLLPIGLAGQSPPCTPPKNSNVARLLGWFGSPLAFSQLGPIERMPAGTVKIGGDVTYVP